MLHNTKSAAYLLIFAILALASFSAHWLIPLFNGYLAGLGDFFIPVRYGQSISSDDNYFYYTHIREVLDNVRFSADPLNYEKRDQKTIHYSYSLLIFLNSVGGVFWNSTASIFIFNKIFFIALNFFVIFYFLNLFLKRADLSIFICLLVLYFSDSHTFLYNPFAVFRIALPLFSSTPPVDIQVFTQLTRVTFAATNVLIFVAAILFYNYFELRDRRFLTQGVISILCAVSPLFSGHSFVILYAMLFLGLIVYARPKVMTRVDYVFISINAGAAIAGLIFLVGLMPLASQSVAEVGVFANWNTWEFFTI
ncbi:MAG: hypothetical protein P8N43_00180, partial [Alphaproteobacteria bacterium]|nr:hypothetical protein [Alphaproteobacteria bacterium]